MFTAVRTDLFKALIPRRAAQPFALTIVSHLFNGGSIMSEARRTFDNAFGAFGLFGSRFGRVPVGTGGACSGTLSEFAKVLSRFSPCLSNETRVDTKVAFGKSLCETIKGKEHLLSINSGSHFGKQEMADVMFTNGKTDKVIFAVGAAHTLGNNVMGFSVVNNGSAFGSFNDPKVGCGIFV